jgi:hypothetical protein
MESANPTSLQPGEPFNPYGLFNGIFIPEAICKFRGLSLGAKVVYGRLYRFAGKDGKAYPSVPTLGAEVGISAKQARRYVRELEDQRFIRSERTTGRQNHYLFFWHTRLEASVETVACTARCRQQSEHRLRHVEVHCSRDTCTTRQTTNKPAVSDIGSRLTGRF